MVRIVTFEGVDYSGKSSAFAHLSKMMAGRGDVAFNEGPVHPTGLTARLLIAANQSNETEREFLYTMVYALDSTEARKHPQDDRVVLQDRYWPSVIAYGRFLNGNESIHAHQDYRPLFIHPAATILFSCSRDEKIRRGELRGRKSVLDRFLLTNPAEFDRLEAEVQESVKDLQNVFEIETTGKTIEQVGSEIEHYLTSIDVL
jgi:thymidylate kinase